MKRLIIIVIFVLLSPFTILAQDYINKINVYNLYGERVLYLEDYPDDIKSIMDTIHKRNNYCDKIEDGIYIVRITIFCDYTVCYFDFNDYRYEYRCNICEEKSFKINFINR